MTAHTHASWRLRWLIALLAAAFLALALPAPALGAGELVAGFGSGGKVLLPIAPGANNAQVHDAVVLQNGKIVLVGVAYQDGPTSDGDGFIAQLNADGSPDSGFGSNGVTVTPVNLGSPNGNDIFRSVAVGPGGELVVAGDVQASSGNDIVVGRYGANGQIDGTFGGGDGILTFSIRTFDTGQAVGVLADGSPVVAGAASDGLDSNASAALTRVLANGSGVDPAFGPGGTAFTSLAGARLDQWNSLVVDTGAGNGTITVGGGADMNLATTDFALGRFDDTTGVPVATFNGGAFVTPGPGTEFIEDIALFPDGGVLAAGQGNQNNVPAFQLASFTPSGQLNNGFDGDGHARVEFPFAEVNFAGASGVAIAPDGRVLVGGSAFTRPFPATDAAEFALARLNPNGALDFKITHDVGGANDFAGALALTSPDAAILAGTSFSGGREVASAIKVDLAGGAPPAGGTPATPPVPPTEDGPLEVKKRALLDDPVPAPISGVAQGQTVRYHVDVTNRGAADLEDVTVVDTLMGPARGLPGGADVYPLVNGETVGQGQACPLLPRRKGFRCEIGRLGVGETRRVVFFARADGGASGDIENSADASGRLAGQTIRASSEIRLDVYIFTGTITFDLTKVFPFIFGEAGIKPLSQLQASQRRARSRLRRVEIALLRDSRSAPRTCTWLGDRRARFRRVRSQSGRTCDRPIWLRARGTRRWSFRMKRRLPAGRYVILRRATSAQGAVESIFSARRRNLVKLVVPSRR